MFNKHRIARLYALGVAQWAIPRDVGQGLGEQSLGFLMGQFLGCLEGTWCWYENDKKIDFNFGCFCFVDGDIDWALFGA